MTKLIFLVSEDWYFVSHRLHLASRAVAQGVEVVICTRKGDQSKLIEDAGVTVIPFQQERRGLSPLGLLREAWRLSRIYRREKPDVVHHVALRPVVVGEIAAWLAGVRSRVSAINGLGHLFTEDKPTLARRVLERILPLLLSRSYIIVQNRDDAAALTSMGVKAKRIHVIAGSGVDTEQFKPQPRTSGAAPVVLLSSRMLWDKGIGEFVEAARMLSGSGARFVLVGRVDEGNPSSISEQQLQAWVTEGIVEWWGHRSDMPRCLNEADIVCLPSYREGLPKALLEAMACGKPCVATDVPGCRDAVRHEENGLLVRAKDAQNLSSALATLLSDANMRQRMGENGRIRALNEFAIPSISDQTFQVYREANGAMK